MQTSFIELQNDDKPALCFAAHLANWELPAVMAAAHGLPSAVLYRMPNNKAVANEIARIRAPLMGRLIRSRAQAPLEMAGALDRGEHLGMLVDQHFSRGVDVTFFGRRCKANPEHCPPRPPVRLPRDGRARDPTAGPSLSHCRGGTPSHCRVTADGRIDVQQATQLITSVVERWIREHPEQWLWFHRRWR